MFEREKTEKRMISDLEDAQNDGESPLPLKTPDIKVWKRIIQESFSMFLAIIPYFSFYFYVISAKDSMNPGSLDSSIFIR